MAPTRFDVVVALARALDEGRLTPDGLGVDIEVEALEYAPGGVVLLRCRYDFPDLAPSQTFFGQVTEAVGDHHLRPTEQIVGDVVLRLCEFGSQPFEDRPELVAERAHDRSNPLALS